MAATQAESQRSEANVEQNPSDQPPDSRSSLLQNGTDKMVGRAPPDGAVNTKSKSPQEPGAPRDGGEAPGHDRGGERPPPDQYGHYRYPDGADPYYAPRPGFPGKPRPPPPQQQQRYFQGQPGSQAPGPTPTLNSLLQSSGAPPHRYPNSYDQQPPAGYGPGPGGWPPPRPGSMGMPPYNPQAGPYRNSTPPRGAPGYGGAPYGAPPGSQQPPGGYGPPGSYPQRYPPSPGPPGAPNNRPPFSAHQGYERGGSPQPPHPAGAPSPGPGSGPALSPNQDSQHPHQHPPHPNQHGPPPQHQGYPPPPRPGQPSTPNAHDPENDLTGQNSNDSGGSGGAGRSSTPHLRPTPSPTGSSGSRSMSPAVGTQNAPMPPRPSSSLSDGAAPAARPPGAPPPAPAPAPPGLPQPYHGYKPPHYPPQPYPYPPRNHHPYPYPGGYPPPPRPPQHYPPLNKQQSPRHMGPPGADAMPPPTAPGGDSHDNGPAAPPATALVTTGPDGAPLDEGSQQSTLSNASAASGEEACGPGAGKPPRKEYSSGAAPSPSPGAGGHGAHHDDYDASPGWSRPPASPKSDSLGKLYEMDEAPERRGWVERLLAFMEERRTPIAACPTISKQPLDLYKLYLLVRDRGGFVEVTKNKTWKDIAGLLGIGASSSAAYTLRKHYTKNLLAYECHFDRGGIDPQPIINQVEATTKKKSGSKNTQANAGSSNTQETFPSGGAPGTPGAPMDGYGGGQYGYPPQPNQSQGGGPGGDNLAASNPFDEPPGPRRPPGYQPGYGGYEYGSPYPPGNRPVYPPYGPEGDRSYGSPGAEGQYRYSSGGAPGGGGTPGGAAAAAAAASPGYPGYRAPAPPPGTPPPQHYQDYYRAPPAPQQPPPPINNHQPQHEMSPPLASLMSSQLARQLVAPLPPANKAYSHYPGGKPPGSAPGLPPGVGVGAAPRRHPDFAGKEPYPPPGTPARPPFPGAAGAWPQQFPPRPPPHPPQQQGWRPPGQPGQPGPPGPPGPPPGQWAPYPPHQGHQPPQPASAGAWGGASRPAAEPYPSAAAPSPGVAPALGAGAMGAMKREVTFPAECVEAAVPSAEKRRRLTKADVGPVDAWRIMMALKSGLLAETCWALDILNILLFDDSCVGYFGLQHMPGLLDLLLEHFHKSLSDVFDAPPDDERAPPPPEPARRRADPPPDPAHRTTLLRGRNYTLESRRHRPVSTRPDELFASDDSGDEPERAEDSVLEPWQPAGDLRRVCVPPPDPPRVPYARPAAPPPCRPRRRAATPPAPVPAHHGDNLECEPMELEPERTSPAPPPPAAAPAADCRLAVRDPAGVLRRRRLSAYEDECYTRDPPSLHLVSERQEALARRLVALSNILRSLTFVPGNEPEFARSPAFLALAGRLLLLHHEHAPRAARARAYQQEDSPAAAAATAAATTGVTAAARHDADWWWDALLQLRSDALVTCANVAGSVELAAQPEAVARPLLDGLLHWAVCGAAVAGDAPGDAAPHSRLSPRRLALEALCKLCVTDENVDLVLATPPRERVGALCAGLARDLCRAERPVAREFAVNLLHYVAGAGSAAAREVALQAPVVSQLVAFIERAEQAALGVANQHGVGALRDNPDAMGTSLDMLRRAAGTLARLARHPDNRALLRRHERRLLALVMSQILDQKVAHELADVLYQCSRQ